MADNTDFLIEDGILERYLGADESVAIPDGVKGIGGCAFCSHSKIKQVIIPDTVQEIGDSVFAVSGIESVVIPDSVTKMGSGVFDKCWYLKSVVIGKGITRLRDYTFRRCQRLKYLELPEALEEIGYDAFRECYSLKTVWVDGNEYRIRDPKAPKPVKLVYKSIEGTRSRLRADYENGSMDEFEAIDYGIAGDGYDD